jgi:hypothetical protein
MDPNTEISVEDAANFLQEDFNKIQGKAPEPTPEPTPAPEPATEATPATTTEPEGEPAAPEKENSQPTTEPDPYSWLEKVEDKELRDKIVTEIQSRLQAEHRIRSDNGRVAAYQRQTRELKNALAQLQAAKNKPSEGRPPAAGEAPSTPEEWNSVIEADPVLAKAVQALLKSEVEAAKAAVRGEFQEKLKGAVDPIYSDRVQQGREQEQQKLLQAVPNALEVVQTPEYQYFINNVAPPGLRKLAFESVDHRDAVAVMRDYASWMIATGQAQPQAASQPQQTTQTPAPAEGTTEADRIAKERAAKLNTPTPGAAPSSPVKAGVVPNNLDNEAANDLLMKYFSDIKSGKRVTQ